MARIGWQAGMTGPTVQAAKRKLRATFTYAKDLDDTEHFDEILNAVLPPGERPTLTSGRFAVGPRMKRLLRQTLAQRPLAFILAVTAALVLTGVVLVAVWRFWDSSSTPEDISKTVDMAGVFEFTTSFALVEGPRPGDPPDITWGPSYLITNRAAEPFQLLNITIDIPHGFIADTNQKVDLVQVKPIESIKVFQTVDEIRGGRTSLTQNPPLRFEPGESKYIQPKDTLMITIDGTRLSLPKNANIIDYLGPILHLTPEDGGYRCSLSTRVDATMTTNRGSVTREVDQALMPAGCKLAIPAPPR